MTPVDPDLPQFPKHLPLPKWLNKFIEARLGGIRESLLASYRAGSLLSSATKGNERELFVQALLAQVFSPAYRFGTGDITGAHDERSGQVDIVVESPFWYSLPMHINGPRLYMAEGVAAVIEVKSNLADQWEQVKATVTKVKKIKRRYRHQHLLEMQAMFKRIDTAVNEKYKGDYTKSPFKQDEIKEILDGVTEELAENTEISDEIPCYAIGFEGWKNQETFLERFEEFGELDGALILDPAMACFRARKVSAITMKGNWSLSVLLDKLALDISEVAKMEMPQLGNYSFGLVTQLFSNPKAAMERILEGSDEEDSDR